MAVSHNQPLKAPQANSLISVYNLRRRVAGQPAVSEEEYDAQAQSPQPSYRHNDSGNEQDRKWTLSPDVSVESDSNPKATISVECDTSDESPQPTQCLFCNQDCGSVNVNIQHMSSQHGLFIPSPEQISDKESFLSYLGTTVFEYKECLYCSTEKSTVDAVQAHMRDKGHCMLNLHADSELLDFWEGGDGSSKDEATTKLSGMEMRLPSGLAITSRSAPSTRTRPNTAQRAAQLFTMRAVTEEESALVPQLLPTQHTNDPHDRRLATRHTMGLSGVSTQQLRTLSLLDKKMKTQETTAKARVRQKAEQQPVKTKYYKTEAPIYQAG
jgi:pre-60S factor REI1